MAGCGGLSGWVTAHALLLSAPPSLPSPVFLAQLIFRSVEAGGLWTFVVFFNLFVALPIMDTVVGVDTTNQTREQQANLAGALKFRIMTLLVVPFQVSRPPNACLDHRHGCCGGATAVVQRARRVRRVRPGSSCSGGLWPVASPRQRVARHGGMHTCGTAHRVACQ